MTKVALTSTTGPAYPTPVATAHGARMQVWPTTRQDIEWGTFRPHTIRAGVDPAVRALCERANQRRMSSKRVAIEAGVAWNSLRRWGQGKNDVPVRSLRAALQAVGLDLAVVPYRPTDGASQ